MSKHYDPNQPRNDKGEWTDGGGASGHALIDKEAKRHGLSKEATDALHKAHDDGKIETRNHLNRTIALATQTAKKGFKGQVSTHLIHAALEMHGKGGTYDIPDEPHQNTPAYDPKDVDQLWPSKHPEGPKVRDIHTLQAADEAGVSLDNEKVRSALLDAHEKGHIRNHAQLGEIAYHLKENGPNNESVAVSAINFFGSKGNYRVPRQAGSVKRLLLQTQRAIVMRQALQELDDTKRGMLTTRVIGLDRELARMG